MFNKTMYVLSYWSETGEYGPFAYCGYSTDLNKLSDEMERLIANICTTQGIERSECTERTGGEFFIREFSYYNGDDDIYDLTIAPVKNNTSITLVGQHLN